MVVNESLPGPVIYVNKGDTLYVNVHNLGNYKLTIHWHGVKQPRNPWSDGPEYITQCAIKPGTNFTYQVIFSDEEGTLWWHAHSDWTRNTVHGAIVIYPDEGNSYPFPNPHAEQILVLGSWYIDDMNLVVDKALETGVNIEDSNAYTINGQLGDFYPCSQESTSYRWQVEYGKTYLVRVVNAAMNSQMFFTISQHNLRIVGMDGSYLKPFNSSCVVIAPGNTMDILVTADQPVGRYYIAARQFYTGSDDYPDYDNTTATAILEYKGNNSTTSPSFPYHTLPYNKDFNASISFRKNLKSLKHQNVPTNISTHMYITAAVNEFHLNDTEALSTSLTNVTWMNPLTDVLHAYYNNLSGFYTEDFPDMPPTFFDFVAEDYPENAVTPSRGTEVKVLEYGEEVEIVFQATNVLNEAIEHPMHLHGHNFYIVGYGNGNFDFKEDPKTYNLIDPPFVNTASVPKYGWLAVRFRAVNPGVWLWHCHMARHLSWGMATVFIVKNGESADTSLRKPPPYMPPCDETPPSFKLWKSQYSLGFSQQQ
ncbi:putative laccase-9 isoform X2 [Euphorbia lathyris]